MKKNFLLFLLLAAWTLQCCASTDKAEFAMPRMDVERWTDSVFSAMTADERIMQLYIYAPENSQPYILKSGPVPGGVLLPVSTVAAMKKQIDALGEWGEVPGLIVLNFDRPIPGTPNYMNPYNVAASRHDSLVSRIVTNTLTDTLRSIGFHATAGFMAEQYGLRPSKTHTALISLLGCNDTARIATFLLTPVASVKTALQSDNPLIAGHTTPEMFLLRAQKALKDNPELLAVIDQKAKHIIRLKYSLSDIPRIRCNDISTTEAATICALKAVNCLKNDNKMLPLPSGGNIEIIQIGGLRLAGFSTQAGVFGSYHYKYADTSITAVGTVLNARHRTHRCVILLNAPIENPATIAVISRAANDDKVCVVNFDNPNNLTRINGKCLLQQTGNNVTAAQMAARAVFGTIDVGGDCPVKANKLKYTILRESEFNACYRDTLDSIISFAIDNFCFPGCQVFAAKDGKVLIDKAYGHFTYDSLTRPVNTTDLYDLASLTKVTATTLLAMHLCEKKMMDTEKTLGNYLHYDDSLPKPVLNVKIKSLLEHRSGIYAYTPIIRFGNNASGWKRLGKSIGLDTDTMPLNTLAAAAYNELYRPDYHKDSASTRVADSLWLRNQYVDSLRKFYLHLSVKRKKYQYSDVNMILLQWAAEEVLKCRADSFLARNFYQPLGMTRTCHTPLLHNISADQIAPTEAQPWTKKLLQGDVHDPAAALLGGISGNAGLFSTAYNIGVLFQMLLNGGEYGGKRFFEKKTVEKFTAKQPNTKRALGFDMAPNNFCAVSSGPHTYGHTGFTGTCAWADPDNNIVVVFTCNRVYPDANNKNINTLKIRQKICQAVYDGCGIAGKEESN